MDNQLRRSDDGVWGQTKETTARAARSGGPQCRDRWSPCSSPRAGRPHRAGSYDRRQVDTERTVTRLTADVPPLGSTPVGRCGAFRWRACDLGGKQKARADSRSRSAGLRSRAQPLTCTGHRRHTSLIEPWRTRVPRAAKAGASEKPQIGGSDGHTGGAPEERRRCVKRYSNGTTLALHLECTMHWSADAFASHISHLRTRCTTTDP